jgi:hypothetical protein
MEDMVHSRQFESILRKRLHKHYGRFLETLATLSIRRGLDCALMAVGNREGSG